MSENVETLIRQIISFINEKEKLFKNYLEDENVRLEKNDLTTGVINSIDITWKYKQLKESRGINIHGTILFASETSKLAIRNTCKKLTSNLRYTEQLPFDFDTAFLKSSMFKDEITPSLKEYLQKKVENEVYGGFYDRQLTLNLKLSTNTINMNPVQVEISVFDKNRINQLKQKIHDYIARETYEDINIEMSYNLLPDIIQCAVEDFRNEFGNEKLMAFFDGMIQESEKSMYIYKDQLMRGFTAVELTLLGVSVGAWHTGSVNVETDMVRKPTEEELSLACDIAMLLLHGDNKYDTQDGETALKIAKKLGSQRAKDILRLGTGKIPKEIMQYKDKNINCIANDIKGIVEITIKNECEEAYESAVLYIIRLLEHGFLNEYRIKTKFNKKEYTTATESFWHQCAKYPNLWPLMKEYADINSDRFDYYSDASDEYSVPVGGYAVFALGKASEENKDIVEAFIDNCDEEHAESAREYASEYIHKYGLHKNNIPVITICMQKANDYGSYDEVIKSLEDIELLKKFVAHMEETSDKGEDEIYVSEIIERLWENDEQFNKFIDEQPSEYKPYYEKMIELSEMY